MSNRLQPTALRIGAGESVSGPTDLTQHRPVALYCETVPAGGVTLRFYARPRETDGERREMPFLPVGGGFHFGVHVDAPGHFPAPDWLSTTTWLRCEAFNRDNEPYTDHDGMLIWLVCEVAR